MSNNSINTNYGAAVALQTLNATNAALNTSQNRISTGLKVNSAADDSAVYSIAQSLRAQNAALDTVTTSLNRGISTTGVASTAGSAISDLLTQVQSTVLAASDTSLDAASRAAYQQKYQSLTQQISTYVKNASFNGVNLLDGSTSTYSALANADGTQTIKVAGQNLTVATGATGGSIGTYSSIAGSSTAPTLATYGTRVTQASTLTVNVDNVAYTVNLSTTGGSQGNGTYTTSDLVSAINGTTGLAGVASVDSNGGLKLTSQTNATTNAIAVSGTINGAAATAAQLGLSSLGGTAQSLATAFTETGGGGVINFSGQESFTATTNYADLISKIKTSISNVNTALGSIGAASNAFTNHATFVSKLQDSLTTGIGNLVDADVAKESANLNALQTKQQLGVQALSIANSSSSVLLSLFRG
ncbi:MAG: flagellin [Caulobacteraceae bacterium]|nr:flagellin [Caulobacter sp.]